MLDDPPRNYADAVRRVFAAYASAQGKSRYADKTPGYARELDTLAALLPEARFVHLVRDGRDVAPAIAAAPWGPKRLGDTALTWQRTVNAGRAAGLRLGRDRYHEVSYEQLVSDAATTLARLCAFIDVPFDPAMLQPESRAERMVAGFRAFGPHTSLRRPITQGLRDWRCDLADRDVALIETMVGDTLVAAGYELRFSTASIASRVRGKAARIMSWRRRQTSRTRRRMARSLKRSQPRQ